MLNLIYTSSKTITPFSGYWNNTHICYLKTWDAMLFHESYMLRYTSKLFRDGSLAKMIINPPSTYFLFSRVYGRHAWLEASMNRIAVLAADEIMGYNIEEVISGSWEADTYSRRPGNFIDDEAGIAITCYYSSILRFWDLSTGNMIAELNLGTGTGIQYDHLAWAGYHRIVAIDYTTGKVVLLDYIARIIIWQTSISPCILAAYDCVHNLVITIQSDHKVRVYIMEAVPYTLQAPYLVPTETHLHRLTGTVVKTRLTGDQGEVIPNYWIHWSLLGTPIGSLEKERSKTDENGYAENYYFGPEVGLGSDTIKVRVVI